MKTLEFIYQETQIHFLVNPLDKNVMVNATEMAKLFDKRMDVFLKSEHAKAFIKVMEKDFIRPPYGGRIIDKRGRNGTYFDRRLALKFAAWLSPEFEYWVYATIDEIIFGNYKKHWEAHAKQEIAKSAMQELRAEMIKNPSHENVLAYFKHEKDFKAAKKEKGKAIRNQLNLFKE